MNNEPVNEHPMHILRMNVIIAEFMGGKEYIHKTHFSGLMRIEAELIEIADLRFDKSWDWLMPVIEKIRNNGFVFNLEHNSVTYYPKSEPMAIISTIGPDSLSPAYKAVASIIRNGLV